MFKLFKNLLPAESTRDSDSALTISQSGLSESLKAQISQADALWEQGKLSDALAIYGLAIEQNPDLPEIQRRLAARIKHQGDLAIAYEKLATELKNNGKIKQAANYYRQAIYIKAIAGNTSEQLLNRSSTFNGKKTPIPLASLKETAFSFQPLVNANSQIVRVNSPQVEIASDDISPSFARRIKAINPQQAKDIDWETAQVYLQKALDHLEKQEWEQSALACKQATLVLPNMAEAYKIWGNALQRMGKTADAMSCYAKAVEIKPNLAEVYAGLADIYAEQNKLQQAVKHYQKAIIIRPSAKVYRSMAKVWQKLGDLEQSRYSISKALELESPELDTNALEIITGSDAVDRQSESIKTVDVYCTMARQLEQQNEWQKAAQYYRKALDVSVALVALPASKNKGVSAPVIAADRQRSYGNGKLKKDSDSNQQKLELSPNDISRVETLSKKSETQLDKAIRRYYKQSKLQPNSPKIHTDLGNLYSRKGVWQNAIACYRQAITLKPGYANAHLNYARVLLKIGKKEQFIQEMKLALNIKAKIGSALDRFYLANALAEQGDNQQAIGFYCQAIALNPKLVQAYHRVAEVLSKQYKYQQAIEFLKQGISENSHDVESFYLLGQQFEAIESWDNAVKIYSKVMQLDPQFPGASQKLNRALAQKLKLSKR
ncbi:MAG: tetratricopeptide repeat protein [Cyanobacteria bacterium P01_G01_bin.19]